MRYPFSYPRYPWYSRYPRKNYNNTMYGSPYYSSTSQAISSPCPDSCTKDTTKTETPETKEENPFFEILGVKLYFDDILILCLLFFLYNEGVKDYSLFISLVLLLLS